MLLSAARGLVRPRGPPAIRGIAALAGSEREEALQKLQTQGWQYVSDRDAVSKTFTFSNFNEAWRFMSGTALKAETMNHHPEWFNVYNRVDVTLTTHDAGPSGGLSKKDLKLATFMDDLAK